jgi:hypothetical protein
MADAYTDAANALKAVIEAVYDDVPNIQIAHDELHEALGTDGPCVGIAPLREIPVATNRTTQQTYIQIQFFNDWEKEIDPTQEVDPRIITQLHARLMDALRTVTVTVGDIPWYYQWEGTEYPRDPTGNKTRFVTTLRAWSVNAAEYETT